MEAAALTSAGYLGDTRRQTHRERVIDDPVVQIHPIIEMISVDLPRAMGVVIPFSRWFYIHLPSQTLMSTSRGT